MRYLKKTLTLVCSVLLLLGLRTSAIAQPASGLVASYQFIGNADDVSGNNNHGTVEGASLTTDRFGNPNCAFTFSSAGIGGPSVDQIISIPPTVFSSNEGTISLWFFIPQDITGNTGSGSIILTHAATETREEGGDPGVADFLSLALGDFTLVLGGEILGNLGGTGINNNKRSAVHKSATGTIAAGWHHIALTSDATGHRFFLDGVEHSPHPLLRWLDSFDQPLAYRCSKSLDWRHRKPNLWFLRWYQQNLQHR